MDPSPVLEEDELVAVGEWPDLSGARERALVALAMGKACRIRALDEGFALEVEPRDEAEVREEIELYENERAAWWVTEPAWPIAATGLEPVAAWAAALVAVFLWQQRSPELTERALNSSLAVWREGEWWRPFTSLFLHADGEHLLGNVFIGGAFCLAAAATFGAWRGWGLILLSGALGNLLNGWLHLPESFRSLGASTATFGALGLVVGGALGRLICGGTSDRWRRVIVPLGVGLALLGFFGIGGPDTDVLGHLCGCGCGAVLGFLAAAGRR